MAYLRWELSSGELGMSTSLAVILPDSGALSEAPVIWLLHGLGDNCTGWSRLTSVERYARTYGAAVIMPEVQRSFYTDMVMGPKYLSYLTDELPAQCRRVFGLSGDREKNFVMGLSMGGYGAMKLALLRPERFGGCAAFSAVTELAPKSSGGPFSESEFRGIFGGELEKLPEQELSFLLEKRRPEELPPFFLTCGQQDSLFPENCRFAGKLAEAGAEAEFHQWPGDHTWDFWDASLAMAMERFLGK